MTLIDSYNRKIDYLRISVTDRCNFRCVYCMPEEGAPVSPKEEILTFEEIERLARIAVGLGLTKIRLTGGEPLVRKDIEQLVNRIGAIAGLRDFSLTTNGFLLARHAVEFARSGLKRVNISLDTLHSERFARIARRGGLEEVLAGIEAARSAGLTPIKLNCVVMRGWNEDEVVDFARLSLDQPYHLRFIELMPINWSQGDDSPTDIASLCARPVESDSRIHNMIPLFANVERASFRVAFRLKDTRTQIGQLDADQMRRAFVPAAEIRAHIETALGPLEPAEILTNGPARSFCLPHAKGTVGFISQITNDMCLRCNRIRLTADGQLRPCLMADGEVDLRAPLRAGAKDEEIADLFRLAVLHKPKEHRLEDGLAPISRNMSQLGG
ncbi:MAG TPA: GTP 3',8-cyclase MoaA [Chthonomonadaceae bacterium]|nr:GTP 3',8-cyclase MoaA [Chthonomonadaceae bacterium]